MTVELNSERDAYVVKWDKGFSDAEEVDLRTENSEGDVSERKGLDNDGNNFVNVPSGYHGTFKVTISDDDGNEETGEITV